MNYKGQNKIIYLDDKIIKFLCESKKYWNQEVIIDSEDWDKIKNYHWCIRRNKNLIYVLTRTKINKFILQRLILNLTNMNFVIDHINHNGLDNRKCNLRICTQSENSKNQKLKKNNTSGFKGVYWDNLRQKWHCQIMINRKCIYLGLFVNKIDAALTYNNKAKELFGEFACLNKL
jgi:hypothetical protein